MHNDIINEMIDTRHPTISINPVLVAMLNFFFKIKKQINHFIPYN